MVPLNCACVRGHTGHETSAHKKTCSAHKMFLPKMILHIFLTLHYTYRLILVRCCTKEILCAQRLEKLEGTLVVTPRFWTGGSLGSRKMTIAYFAQKV